MVRHGVGELERPIMGVLWSADAPMTVREVLGDLDDESIAVSPRVSDVSRPTTSHHRRPAPENSAKLAQSRGPVPSRHRPLDRPYEST